MDVSTVALMLSGYSLVIRDILVPHGVQNIADNHRLHMVEQDEEPHCNDSDRKTVADKENRFVFQGISNGDGGDGKPSVRENHGPPTQVEVDSPRVNNLAIC
jgi:hypothetical protein